MTSLSPDPAFPDRMGARLEIARARRFVGRADELLLFQSALDASEPPFTVLWLYGPGGVGKSALLDAFARVASNRGIGHVRLDGRDLDPSPDGFLSALPGALDSGGDVLLDEEIVSPPRRVLLIDTYERIGALDTWLREAFFPALPPTMLVVISGRHPPAPSWRTDPGWGALVRVLPIRNLTLEESEAYLKVRGVPESRWEDAISFTHGHPLALSLVADLLTQERAGGTSLRVDAPDVVRVLLEQFVNEVPDHLGRRALQVCAHVRVTTEPMLAHALEIDDARPVFEWLRGLSFIEQGPEGLFPHDLARDVLEADLRWRNPDEYRDMHRRTRDLIVRNVRQASGRELQRATFDLVYLHRNSPIMKPRLQWASLGSAWIEALRPPDTDDILRMVARHEGEASADIARHWLERQPDAFRVFRSAEGIIGFAATLRLDEVTPDDRAADPAVGAALGFIARHGSPRPGEEVMYHRFAMGREAYQAPSPAWDMLVMMSTSLWVTTPRLAWSLLALADPDQWASTMAYINLHRAPDADFTVGGYQYGVFAHDWRAQPPAAWLDMMADREIDTGMSPDELAATLPPPVIVLSEPQFADAVRRALRDYHRPDALARNPLARSWLVTGRAGESSATTLRDVLDEGIASLRQHPRDERLYRALHRTFIVPAPTQELAAEALDLPFSTYRYHLTTGIRRITDMLWQREIAGSGPT